MLLIPLGNNWYFIWAPMSYWKILDYLTSQNKIAQEWNKKIVAARIFNQFLPNRKPQRRCLFTVERLGVYAAEALPICHAWPKGSSISLCFRFSIKASDAHAQFKKVCTCRVCIDQCTPLLAWFYLPGDRPAYYGTTVCESKTRKIIKGSSCPDFKKCLKIVFP